MTPTICARCKASPRNGRDRYCRPCRVAYGKAWWRKHAAAIKAKRSGAYGDRSVKEIMLLLRKKDGET